MHLKVKEPRSKALPSLAVLALCLAIAFLSPSSGSETAFFQRLLGLPENT
jgi:hypothetical protein